MPDRLDDTYPNRVTNVDLVDGMLVFERYDGSKLSVPQDSGTSLVHVEVPIAFNTAGLSVPVEGLIPGATIYMPTVGDFLVEAWVQVTEAWNGMTPKGGMGYFDYSGALPLEQLGNGAIDMTTVDPDPPLEGYLFFNGGNLSLVGQGAYNGIRIVPGRFGSTDPFRFLVSDDGSNTGGDPGASAGAAIVHLLILPATT